MVLGVAALVTEFTRKLQLVWHKPVLLATACGSKLARVQW